MTAPSDAEEFDPKTGTFRPIQKPAAARRAAPRAAPRPTAAARKAAGGLSETGERYGVFYEAFEHAFKTDSAKYAEWVAKGVIVVVFLLLLYEAITYRAGLG